nr:hypothetical protein StreXyl84_05820 [Streptomyces sp. Xyl84]
MRAPGGERRANVPREGAAGKEAEIVGTLVTALDALGRPRRSATAPHVAGSGCYRLS